MRVIYIVCIFYFVRTIASVLMFSLCLATSVAAIPEPQTRKSAVNQINAAYENVTISEDVSWQGTIVVKGALVVAPQATLRIEPGTVIRFMQSKGSQQLPCLVVMGRIQAIGSSERPILFTHAGSSSALPGAWGGVLLLSTEKRNQFDLCRIEGAGTALEARFSTFSAKSITVAASTKGMVLRDSIASISASNVTGCETGIEAYDSELDLKGGSVAQNRRGLELSRTSSILSSVTVTGNNQIGLLAEECRIKITGCEVSSNKVGAQIKGGEGQILMCRFIRNIDTGLHLSSARLKVSRCQISDNLHDGLRMDDNRATVWGSSFSGNGNYNLVNGGGGSISAAQNWWGAADEASIAPKIFDAVHDPRTGQVNIYPWLPEKPILFP